MTCYTPPRDLYPFESRWFEQPAGLRQHYVDEGAGPPVVMVHGNPSWSFLFRELIKGLRGEFRCVAPDHIGCGLSDKPDDSRYHYTLSRRIDDLERLIESVIPGGGPITLALHDWGGAIGMGYAARHPERVGRLILMNTASFRNPKGNSLPFTLWLVRNTPLGAALVRGLNAFASGATRMAVTRPMSRDVRSAFVGPYGSWADRIATLRFVQDIPLGPKDPAYDEMLRMESVLPTMAKLPALVMWGRKDFVFDDAFLNEWRRRLPNAEFHAFDDVGHYTLEDGAERCVPLALDFLKRTAPAPPQEAPLI